MEYQLAPFRFARIPGTDENILIVNEVGEFAFLDEDAFLLFHSGRLPSSGSMFAELRAKHFLLDEYAETFWPYAVSQYRNRKSFLDNGPELHIIVVTLRCDHSCPYCQVSRRRIASTDYDLSIEHAMLVVERIFESRSDSIKIEFQGGEPLLAFDRIKQIVESAENLAMRERRNVEFVIATTLSGVVREQLHYCAEHKISISTSLDGPQVLHDANRPRPGRNSYDRTVAGIQQAREVIGPDSVSALTTLTRASLSRPEEIIDTYLQLGFSSIFLRSLSPFGFAVKSRSRIGYSVQEFLQFYDRALARIVDRNRSGIYLEETYTKILLQQVLSSSPTGYVDLRSPAGAMFGVLVYNYDGGVYASDEGRMLAETGDQRFRLGDIHDTRSTLLTSPAARAIAAESLAESLPGCCDCAFLPYCGADPVGNAAEHGTLRGYRPTSAFCERQTGLFQRLFRMLREPDSEAAQVCLSWLTGNQGRRAPTAPFGTARQ